MGYGDSLIALALAQDAYARDPSRGPVLICDGSGAPRWRPEWDGQPEVTAIQKPGTPTIRIGKGALPYHPWSRDLTWRVRDHRGHLTLARVDQKRALKVRQQYGPYVLIDPPARSRKNRNRVWPGWAALAAILSARLDVAVLQLHHAQTDPLPGIPQIAHPSFLSACAILQRAELAVLTEGGITIAAGTVGTPAVVLWGGCVSLETFGYPEHVNLVDADPQTPCGSMHPCDHCAAAWARLSPEHVAEIVLQTWHARKGEAA